MFQDELSGLRKKWNRFCQALLHGKTGWRAEQSSSVLPDMGVSYVESGMERNPHASTLVAKFRRHSSCTIKFSFGSNHQMKNLTDELSLDGFKSKNDEGVEETKVTLTLALGHSPFPSN